MAFIAPEMAESSSAVPDYLSHRQLSAFGTEHPIDKTLGLARRIGSYHQATKGASASDTIHAASSVVSSATGPVGTGASSTPMLGGSPNG